jgi:hypothetical protein
MDGLDERLHRARGCSGPFSMMVFSMMGLSAVVGCAGASSQAASVESPTPAPTVSTRAALPPAVGVEAELGGLDENEAERSFRASLDGLQECVIHGVERLEFMGGSIEFAVKVDANRQATNVWAAESSLGERSTEKCMFEALRAVSWPAPQGGLFGIARNSFEFEPKKDAPTPGVWDAGRVADVVGGLQNSLDECGQGSLGPMLITLYIGDGGKALAGGAASDEPLDEDRVDCVVDALLGARYPQPERTPTKVRFRL